MTEDETNLIIVKSKQSQLLLFLLLRLFAQLIHLPTQQKCFTSFDTAAQLAELAQQASDSTALEKKKEMHTWKRWWVAGEHPFVRDIF